MPNAEHSFVPPILASYRQAVIEPQPTDNQENDETCYGQHTWKHIAYEDVQTVHCRNTKHSRPVRLDSSAVQGQVRLAVVVSSHP
jgi:hypothetical protein